MNHNPKVSAYGSPVAEQTLELVFIDGSISNLDQMIADLQNESTLDTTRTLDVVVLDPNRNGLAQITQTLLNYDSVDGIHIISHGNGSHVQLGSLTLSLDNIDTYRSAFSAWQGSMSKDADLLFYGCNLASTADGRELMSKIGAACDCDVAASEDLTGHEALDGDWGLEYQIGTITTSTAFSTTFESDWDGLLTTYVVTNTLDDGSV